MYYLGEAKFRLETTRRAMERIGTLVHTEEAAAVAAEEQEQEEEAAAAGGQEEEEQEEEEYDEDPEIKLPASPMEVLKHC